jgi:Polyketide cyclase / dehydrase and lipid transport
MVVLENSVDIAVPPQKAFDYLSDLRNEAEWNPQMRSVQLLTGDPIGIGSTYRARWAGGPDTLVEYTRFEWPGEWASVGRSNMMTIRFSARVASIPSGSRLAVRMELIPRGPARLLRPLLRRRMQDQELDNMRAIKNAMESLPAR